MLHVMIIGCGGIAPAHIEGYREFPEDAVITVLADGNLARAEGLIEKYGLTEAKAVADYRECLDEVDVVSICTPPGLHEQMAVNALEAGCHVLLEKPMAPSLAACDRILEAARKSGKLVSVVVQSRYISSIRNAIDMVRGGAYGRTLFTQINSFWHRGQHYENHTGQVQNFLGAILRGETLVATGQDGRNCIELITSIYKSAVTGRKVSLPIAQDDLFYTDAWREQAPHFHEKQSDVTAFEDTTVTNFKNKF